MRGSGAKVQNTLARPPINVAAADSNNWAGDQLRSTLWLLAAPIIFAFAITAFHFDPGKLGLYGFSALFVAFLLLQLRKGPEPLLATIIVYMPLSRLYAARIAPGLNGTNLLELFLVAAWLAGAFRNKRKLLSAYPFTRVVTIWMLLAVVSIFTAISQIGLQPFIWNYTQPLRGFFDQFIIFFLFVNLICDKNMARRIIIYVMLSAAVIYLLGIHEWWGTRYDSSIEKSRLLGPVGQPNDFAALMVYSIAPFLAYGAYYFPRWKSLRLTPIVLVGLRVLLAAFSRGAYLAFAMELFTVAFFKSRKFFILVALILGSIYFFIPALVPNSMKARIAQTYEDRAVGSSIDKSAESRLILWSAAIKMIKSNPILGMGFDQFQRLSPEHTSEPIEASDNQNFFLYTASNMGLPSLIVFFIIIFSAALRGLYIYRRSAQAIDRIIGLSGLTMVAGLIGVNMFGTHVIDTAVDGFFWIHLAVMAHLLRDSSQQNSLTQHAKRSI